LKPFNKSSSKALHTTKASLIKSSFEVSPSYPEKKLKSNHKKMNHSGGEKESVIGLIERTQSDTIKVPLYKLNRIDRPPRPPSPEGWASASTLGSLDGDQSVGGYSVGSYDSGLSFSSFNSKSVGNNNLRDRIKEIEKKIRKHTNRDELPSIHVSPSSCSWDHRVAKKYRKRSRPPVNIIGCHQPSDLIIARADERVRKQVTAKEMREKHMSELSAYIDHLIQMKLTRGERYAEQLEHQRKQTMLLKIVYVCNYIKQVSPMIEAFKRNKDRSANINGAARYLQRGMSMWYEERVNTRYTNFEKVISKYKWRLQLVISIAQKRRASRILRSYLTHRKDKRGQMSSIIHQFLKGVRRLQRMARGFLECKLYRIRSLEKIWLDLEKQYIMSTMATKRAEVNQSSSTKMQSLVIDIKTRIEMDKQNDRWDFTSKKFDRILDLHRARGDLDVKLEADGIESLLAPHAEKKRNLEEMLHEKRKEHILKLQDMQRQLTTSCQFSEDDALSFLKGDIEPGFRVNLSENVHTAMQVLCPFNVYKTLHDDDFLVRIKRIHQQRKTFEITPNNVHLFNAALQNERQIKRNSNGEKVILRRSVTMNVRAYEEHEALLRSRLTEAMDAHQKELLLERKKKSMKGHM
jgi:hypothetical protein